MVAYQDWADIKERIDFVLHYMSPLDWYGAQRGLMEGLDIPMLGGFDGNPELLLENTISKMSYEEARQSIFDTVVKLIEQQLHEDEQEFFQEQHSL